MLDALIAKHLAALPLGGLCVLETTGSTNDDALAWAAKGAADFSIVVADQQTNGRGRLNRRWYTPRECALAVSVIFRPTQAEQSSLGHFSGLGGLAICEALEELGLRPELKWPNDVLLEGKKVAGILLESQWEGPVPVGMVIGMGVNVGVEAVPPAELVMFPAGCVEDSLGEGVDRWSLLAGMLESMLRWRARLGRSEFVQAWENRLAFQNEWVQVGTGLEPARQAKIIGLDPDGGLKLVSRDGQPFSIQVGEISLRPELDTHLDTNA